MTPRDPFAGMNVRETVPEEPAEAIPEVLARRPSRAKRNREWEQNHKTVAYRGIPQALNEEMLKVSETLGIPLSELARAFLEYGLQAYEAGELSLQPQLRVGKMTLFPEASSAASTKRGKR